MNLRTPTHLALTTALISGFSVFVNKYAVSSFADPVLFAGLKNAVVGALLVGVVLMLGTHPEVRTLTRSQWIRLGLIGLIGGSVPFALFFTGLTLVPATIGALIHKTLFVWVALFAVFFLGERFTLTQWLGVATLFAANFVTGGFHGFSGSGGELLILVATVLWAGENILAKKMLTELSGPLVAAGRMVFGALFLSIFLVSTGRIEGLFSLSLVGVGWLLLTSLLLLGYVLTWYAALKHAPASYVAALLVPATLVTNALSTIFGTGTFTLTQAAHTALLLTGTVLIAGGAFRTMKMRSHVAPNVPIAS